MAAAKAVSAKSGIEIAAYVIGPDRDATDIYGEWPDMRGIEESGCLLMRPDQHVAFRAARMPADAEAQLRKAMAQILGKT